MNDSPFREPKITSGYPLDPEEQAAVDRIVAEAEKDWTPARDGSPVHVRSWGAGVRQGILFGVAGGMGVGGALVGLAWYFFG